MRKLAQMFRTRDPERDTAGDAARRKRLADTLADVAREVEREHAGLTARLAEVQGTAAFLAEDDDAGRKADRLSAMEQDLMRAMARSRLLARQLEQLPEIGRAVDACFGPANPSDDIR